jgi:hypothetical protein
LQSKHFSNTEAWAMDCSLFAMKLISLTSHRHHRMEAIVQDWRAAFSEPLSDKKSLIRNNCLTLEEPSLLTTGCERTVHVASPAPSVGWLEGKQLVGTLASFTYQQLE